MSDDFSEDFPVDPSIDPDLAPPVRVSGGEDRRIVGQLIVDNEESEEEDPGPELTNTERMDLGRLMTVGRRHKTINIKGNKVTIRTLDSGDEMRIGLYTKPYLDSQGFSRAYQIATLACGVVEIHGQELWDSLEQKPLKEITDEDEIFAKNCQAWSKFYPIVVSEIYDAIMALEREFAELYIKLGKSEG